jgi:hypothetical protein
MPEGTGIYIPFSALDYNHFVRGLHSANILHSLWQHYGVEDVIR